jgi:nicotinate-nucleotide adenylyltransferase
LRQIGLFCGTFNPIHSGHLLVAECARDQFHLEKVIFITSARPPHRHDVFLPSADRHAMVVAAIKENPFFETSTCEMDREGPSYTVDTYKHFAEFYGKEFAFNLLLGGDNIIHLRSWHKIDEIYRGCRLLIAPRFSETVGDSHTTGEVQTSSHAEAGSESFTMSRPSSALSDLERRVLKGAKYELIDFPFVEISSSAIRRRIKEGHSILYMVPSAVNDMISERSYYQVRTDGERGHGQTSGKKIKEVKQSD